MNEEHLSLLKQVTGAAGHTGGTLYAHLCSTAQLLESWGCPREVCLAGLFHSVYGTQSYARTSVPLAERDRVRDVIGERAERLAYLFCIAERATFFADLGSPRPRIRDRVHDTDLPVSHDDLVALVELELANHVEFMPRLSLSPEELAELRSRVEASRPHVSPPAYRAAAAAVAAR